jgi:hypothetical protein
MKVINQSAVALVILLVGSMLVGTDAGAQSNLGIGLDVPLGDYEIAVANTTEESHKDARLLVMRTNDADANGRERYGLAFVVNRDSEPSSSPVVPGPGERPGKIGDGFVCEDATPLQDGTALSCAKTIAFEDEGKQVFVLETLTVGKTGSSYCSALRDSLAEPLKGRILQMCPGGPGGKNRCVCYELKHIRSDVNPFPPSGGAGSGWR